MWFKRTPASSEPSAKQRPQRVVVALGGNALQKKGEASARAQERVAAETAAQLVPLIKAGHQLVIVHGNGPQVGSIVLHEEALNTPDTPTLPLDSAVAMSQGLIGYWLQQALINECTREGLRTPVITLVTQTVVRPDDPAFEAPSKPIGPFYETEAEALKAASERNFVVKEDAGRGWRRVVPSPQPIDMVEKATVQNLLASGSLVIAGGGGGVSVVQGSNGFEGREAVVDKDATAAMLADALDADTLLILTAVEAVMLNYGTPEQHALAEVSTDEIQEYIAQQQFAPGSMLPKVQASLKFLEKPGRIAIIASLDNAASAISGQAGTIIRS